VTPIVNGVKRTRMIQPMPEEKGVKNRSIPARYPISQKRVPGPKVSLRAGCIRFVWGKGVMNFWEGVEK
jgi:hypothetical protein